MFNIAHLHISINHIPVVLTPVVLCLLLYGAWGRNDAVTRVGLLMAVANAVAAWATYLTGDPAEDIIRRVPDAASASRATIRTLIQRHDDAALYALLVTGALGVVALGALWRFRRGAVVPRWLVTTAIVIALMGSAAMARTAYLGGEIRHPEARPGFVAPLDSTRERSDQD